MKKITPLIIGSITGLAMVGLTLTLYASGSPANSPWQFLAYPIYASGILLTLYFYSRSDKFIGKFADLFGQGFRCFIAVTLIMVAFAIIFAKMHPEFADEAATYYKEQLIKEGNKTPGEIDDLAKNVKKQYVTGMVSLTIFRYLILGALFTAAGSLLMRRK